MKSWTIALVLVVLVAAVLIASLAIHNNPPPTCLGDGRNVPGDPCYEPAA